MREGRSFEHTPDSVPAARHFAREVVRGATADTVEAIELMVSELATNCVRHTDSGFDLAITLSSEEIRVEVADRGVGEPGMRTPGPSDPSGRGLRIVDMLSSDWGHEKRPGGGKTVWFTIAPEGESTAAGVDAERAGHAHEEHASRRVTRAFDEWPGQIMGDCIGWTRTTRGLSVRHEGHSAPTASSQSGGAVVRSAIRVWTMLQETRLCAAGGCGMSVTESMTSWI